MSVTPLNEVLASIFVLRTLVVVWGLPPLLVCMSPFAIGTAFKVLDYITNGYGFLSTAGTMVLTFFGQAFIAAYAPSKRHRDDAFRKSLVVLPVLSFLVFQVLLHFFMVPLSAAFGFKDNLTVAVTPYIPYVDTIKVGISMFILGSTVMLRFIGHISVVRCSAFPVISRPLTTSLRWFLSRWVSLEAIAAPSDTPGVLISSPFATSSSKGRRYQGPPLRTASLLICISLCCAISAAYIVGGSSSLCLNAFCLSVVSHVLITCLDGKSHELNPLRFQHTNVLGSLSFSRLDTYIYSILMSATIVPLSIFFQSRPSDEIPWVLLGYSLLIAVVTTLYLSVVDLMARTFLCSTGFSLRRLIFEVTSDFSPDLGAQVIIKAVLFGDDELFQTIIKPTAKVGTNSLEEEELSRSKQDADRLAIVLTTKSADFGLADDMLRVLILESFGGGIIEASTRHEDAVKMLVTSDANLSAGQVEPPSVPVLRALCAYVAGMGVAILKVSKPTKPKERPLNTPATFATWALPPGAFSCSERAMVGATRMIIQSITGPSGTNWRDTHLSMFVPVLLVSAFQLRSGIETHEKETLGRTKAGHSPMLRVKQTCDSCVAFLLKTLQSTDSRMVELTIQDKDCRAWLAKLLDQSGKGPAGTPPVLILENDKPLATYNKRGFALKYY